MKSSRKLYLGHFLVFLVVIGCLIASFWQFSRLSERKDLNEKISKAMQSKPIDLPQELFGQDSKDTIVEYEYRPVEITGEYIEDSDVLVAGRTFEGQPGFNVLTAFKTVNEDVIIFINRGWISQNLGDSIIDKKVNRSVIEPSQGFNTQRTVVGLFRKNESKRLLTTSKLNKETRVSTLISSEVLKDGLQTNYAELAANFWIQEDHSIIDGKKVAKSSPSKEVFPKQILFPELNERNHLSYAIQFLSFALIAIITWIVILRKQRKVSHK